MIESTSSCTKASALNENFMVAKRSIEDRKAAPGRSACLASQASRRAAMPLAWGIPPMPAGCSITRLLSVMANWPSRKKPSRGVVAIQLGLPRPALRKADCVVLEVFLASWMSSSLISNGLKASNLRSVRISAMGRSQCSDSAHQHDKHHAPDRQQCISDCVGHGIAEPGDL